MAEKARYDESECSMLFLSSGAKLFLNRDDNRAKFLIRKRAVSQEKVFDLWTGLLAHLSPTAIIDIGANYGEMFLPRRIPASASLDLYEANPSLIPFLERSRAAHPDRDRIRIFNSGVSDRAGTLTFNVDQKWSGTSSFDFESPDAAFKGDGAASFDRVEVSTATLDDVVAAATPAGAAIAVKIDTEGHEAKIVANTGYLRERRFVMVMEANPLHLKRAGSNIGTLFTKALALGSAFRVTKSGGLDRITATSSTDECDLMVTNVPEIATWAETLHHPPPTR